MATANRAPQLPEPAGRNGSSTIKSVAAAMLATVSGGQRMARRTAPVVLLIILSVPSEGYAQWTVPKLIAEGVSEATATAPSGAPPTTAEVLQQTDLLVRGVLAEPRGILSENQKNVYTEYTLKDAVVLYQADVFRATTPGALAPPLTVAILGGTITLDGRTFHHRELGLRALRPGMEGLFFLQRKGDRHFVVLTYWGAFLISDGRLMPMTTREGFAPEYAGTPASEATADLVSRLHALRR